MQGKLQYELFVGASASAVENRWAQLNMIKRRSCAVHGRDLVKAVNTGKVAFFDRHVSMFPQELVYGYYTLNKPGGKLDVVIIEASAITEEGDIVLRAAIGATPEMVQVADKIFVEINTTGPSFDGLHDVTFTELPPHRKPFMVTKPSDRIGTPHMAVDPDKIVAIIESDKPDTIEENRAPDDASHAIAYHLVDFLKAEVKAGRLPPSLLPLQSGLGNVANAIVGGLAVSSQMLGGEQHSTDRSF